MSDGTSEYPGDEQPQGPDAISPEEVREQLRRVLSSETFRNAPRHRLFLDFVVKQALSGEKKNLKESIIGRRVFERPDFDPGTDSTVRAEARRLRARLAAYYVELGRLDPIHIDLPKGYVPVFSRNGVAPQLEETAPEASLAAPTAEQPIPHKTRRWWVAGAWIVVVAVFAVSYVKSHQPAKLTDKDSIVLADFDNKTGDAVFDDTLRQGISVQLEQSPFLDLLSESKINQTLKLMGRSPDERLTPQTAREICQRTGSKAMIIGSIAPLGSQYVIGVNAVNCDTGDLLAEAQKQAAGKEGVLGTLDEEATSLRRKLGESLGSVQKYATPLEQATTPSLEALKAYSLGRKMDLTKGGTAALPLYQRAVELDPNFAMAYRSMSVAYANLNEVGKSAEDARRAYELRAKVSELERFSIEAGYYLNATGELERAAQTYELWQQTYPQDAVPYMNLSFIYGNLGNFEGALEAARQAKNLEPNDVVSYSNLAISYMNLNRLDEAGAVYKQAEDRKVEGEFLLQNRYLLAFLEGDKGQMERMLAAAVGKPGTEDLLLERQADTEAWYGRYKAARETTRQAMNFAERNNASETAAIYQAAAALREVEAGYQMQARADADAALKLASDRDVRAEAALVLARAGLTEEPETLAAELDKRFPLDTLAQKYWLPTIRAAVALERKEPSRAVELLSRTGAIEMGSIGNLDPAYIRGEAYLMLHDGNAAAIEFQKFIDHYGLVENFPWGAAARLGLARAYALEAANNPAARDKARTAYQNFLILWKDADPDVPIYRQAKAEYANLSSR